MHYGPHGPIDVAAFGVDVLICSPYKYFGPHLGVAFARRELSESWRPYKVRPAPNEPLGKRFETGTLPLRAARRLQRRRRVHRLARLGGDRRRGSASSGSSFSRVCPVDPPPRPADDGRPRPDVRLLGRRDLRRGGGLALGERGFAVWWGNYYALEVMKRLGLEDDGGAVRVGFVHYNTAEEVDRLLGELPGSSDAAPRLVGACRARGRLDRLCAPGRGSRCRCRGSLRTRWSTACSAEGSGSTARSTSSAARRRTTRLLTPLFAGFPLAAFGLDSGYDVLQVLQALAMSLAAVPVYLWARSLVRGGRLCWRPRWRLPCRAWPTRGW